MAINLVKVLKTGSKVAIGAGYVGLAIYNVVTSEEKVEEAMKFISKVKKVKGV